MSVNRVLVHLQGNCPQCRSGKAYRKIEELRETCKAIVKAVGDQIGVGFSFPSVGMVIANRFKIHRVGFEVLIETEIKARNIRQHVAAELRRLAGEMVTAADAVEALAKGGAA